MNNVVVIEQKKRIGYLDALRGFTMFLVVFAHVEFFGFGMHLGDSLIGSLFVTFRMPMFFFISGFIAFKLVEWDCSYYKMMMKKKALVQIIPTLFFFYLSSFFHGNDILSFFTKGPQGYWFTVVLFYMFVLYYSTMFLCRTRKPWVSDFVLVSLSIIGALTYIGSMKFYSLGSYPLLCLTNLSRYFEFFVLGNLCRKYQNRFFQFISCEAVKAVLFLSFLLLFILDWNNTLISVSFLNIFNHEFVIRFIGLLFVFSIFYNYKAFFDGPTSIANTFRFIGQRTLDIYLIHYFLLPDLRYLKNALLGPLSSQNTIIELSVVFILTTLIVLLCLVISFIIRSSSFLGHYLLGAKLVK